MFLASAYASPQLRAESCSAMAAVTHYLYLCQFSWMLIQVGTSFLPPSNFNFPINLGGVVLVSDILYAKMEIIPYIHYCISRRSMQENP